MWRLGRYTSLSYGHFSLGQEIKNNILPFYFNTKAPITCFSDEPLWYPTARVTGNNPLCKQKPKKHRLKRTARESQQEAHRPYGHLSIKDFTLTSCQRGAYLHINSPIIIINKNQQLYENSIIIL